jgi:hypothetical protein
MFRYVQQINESLRFILNSVAQLQAAVQRMASQLDTYLVHRALASWKEAVHATFRKIRIAEAVHQSAKGRVLAACFDIWVT